MGLYLVEMVVDLPTDLDPKIKSQLLDAEREYSQVLQKNGVWRHLWRVAGNYANISVFDVADNDGLHEVLWNLPLFPYLTIQIRPLSRHPSRFGDD